MSCGSALLLARGGRFHLPLAAPGVCAIAIKSKMPSFARYEEMRIQAEEAEEEAARARTKAEDERREAEGVVEQPDAPEASNEEILDEFVFESTAGAKQLVETGAMLSVTTAPIGPACLP